MTAGGAVTEQREIALAAQVAAALLDGVPLEAGLETGRLGRLDSAPRFGGPLRRAAAWRADLAGLPIDGSFVGRLRDRPEARLCALIVGQPVAAVRAAALRVAAAMSHRELIGIVLKADRDRLKVALGEDAFAVATQEAALLDTALVQLGAGQEAFAAGDLDRVPGRLAALGGAAFVRFAAFVEPVLADVVARRLPEAADAGGAAGALGERHCAAIVKLLRRRGPGWATLIA